MTARSKPLQTFAEFLLASPSREHSSRVYRQVVRDYAPAIMALAASVADAFLQPVPGLAASVADAIVQAVTGSIGPALTFGSTSLAFAATTIGSNTSMTVTISNPGTADLVITSLIPTGDFAVATITEA